MRVIDENHKIQEKFIYEERPIQQPILFIGAITYKALVDKLNLKDDYQNILNDLSAKERYIFDEITEMNTWKMLQSLSNHYYEVKNIDITFDKYIFKLCDKDFILNVFPYHPNLTSSEILDSFNNLESREKVSDKFRNHDYYEAVINLIYSKSVDEIKRILLEHYKFALKLFGTFDNEHKRKLIYRKDLRETELIEVIEKYEKTNKEIILVSQTAYQPYILVAESRDRVYLYIEPLDVQLNIPNRHVVEGLKSISDTIKLQIIKSIKNGENTLTRLNQVLPASKSTIHHHIHLMKSANVITQRDNTYHVNDEEIEKLFKAVHTFLGTQYD